MFIPRVAQIVAPPTLKNAAQVGHQIGPSKTTPFGLLRFLSTQTKGEIERKFIQFQFPKINFPKCAEYRVTPFVIPFDGQSDQEYANMMHGREQLPFLSRDISHADENREPTVHSGNMYLAYHTRTNQDGEIHRYLLKGIDEKKFPAARALAAREWCVAFISILLGKDNCFAKTAVEKINDVYFVSRRFVNGNTGRDWVNSPEDFTETMLPFQTLIDAYALDRALCSTELDNPGNVLGILDENGQPRSKVMKNTPIVIIDNERKLPNAAIMRQINEITGSNWQEEDPYPGSPTWLRNQAMELGDANNLIESAMKSKDPYLAVLSHRIKQGTIPNAKQLFVSDELIDNIINKQAEVRGVMRAFSIYADKELVSPTMPYNEFADLCQQRRSEGKRVSLADCITGFSH